MTTTAMQLDLFSGAPIRGERAVIVERGPKPEPRRMAMRSIMARYDNEAGHRGRLELIMDCLRLANRPLTDRQIKERLFGEAADMNMVRPRVSDGIKSGRLIEVGEVADHVTGESVRLVWLA